MNARLLIAGLMTLVFGVSNALALTVSNAAGGASVVVTLDYDPATGTANWTRNQNSAGVDPNLYAGASWIYRVAGSGSTSSLGTLFDTATAGFAGGSFSPTVGHWYLVAARVSRLQAGVWSVVSDNVQWYEIAAGTNKVKISLPINKTDRAKTYKLIQGGVEVGTVTLQPGEGLIQTFTVPAGTEVTVAELIEDIESDGPVWVASPGAVTQSPVGTATPTLVSAGGGDPPTTTAISGGVQPETKATADTAKQVWSPTSGVTAGSSDFTVKAYREGVDKIIDAINGDTTATNPDITTPDALWNPDTSVTENAVGKLPAAPVITPPTPLTAISVTLALPKLGGTLTSKVISVDFGEYPYATPIAVFRAICLACMAGWFFYISFNAIRSSFAGK